MDYRRLSVPIRRFILLGCAFSLETAFAPMRGGDSTYQVILDPKNTLGYAIRDTQAGTLMEIKLIGWGPAWGWVNQPESTQKAADDHFDVHTPFTFNAAAAQSIDVHLEGSPGSNTSVVYKYSLSSDKEVMLTMMAAEVLASPDRKPKSLTLTSDGKGSEQTFPIASQDDVPNVSTAVFHFDSGDVTLNIDPPATVQLQNMGFRLKLAAGTFKAGSSATTLIYSFTKPVAYIASDKAMAQFTQVVAGSDWFPWAAEDHASTCAFSMDDWLEKPAGKHGGVRIKDDHFEFEDGTPVKFWGTNITYAQVAPDHGLADDICTRFARYGINAVRLQNFMGPGWEGIGDPNDVTQFDPKALEKFDYLTSKLAEKGIYYNFAHTFNLQVRPGNKDQLLDYDEIQNALQGKTMGLINFSEDIQDLLIKSLVNLIKHTNAYTGKAYVDDPALCYIELQNEDDIFWYDTQDAYSKCPTYAKRLREHFADWLKTKYGTRDALAQAWPGALKDDETLDAKSVLLDMNPYDMTEGFLAQLAPGNKQRMLDQAAFLHGIQDSFYSRYVKAIRDAGYKGPLCGSPWQAPPMVPEYYNLLSDSEVGFIDRHNYYGDETNVFATMLNSPGSGYLSSGLQQVAGHPFALSEWITNFPVVYQSDGPVQMAAYALGLQGWSASYEFESWMYNDNGSWFAPNAGGLPFKAWNVDSPVQMGLFPALARMVYRNDVREGDIISTRNVSQQEIATDKFSFLDQSVQQGDIKSFTGSCPMEALAAGRCVINFTDSPQPSTLPDMSKYKTGSVITSNTGQLSWDSSDKGFFTINTDGTKAVVGFAPEKTEKLGDVTITSHTPYATILLTALDQKATLQTTKSALLVVVARAASTGFSVNLLNNHMLDPGKGPLLVEPVHADIAISGRVVSAVNVLNQNGVITPKTLPLQNGAFQINTGDDHTIYYQVVFE